MNFKKPVFESLELAYEGGIWQDIAASHLDNKQEDYKFIGEPSRSLLRKEG